MTKRNEIVLDDLATRINAEHEACQGAMRSAVEHAVRAGELLLEVKQQIPHGQWLIWLEGRCNVAERTAQAYMRLARELPKLEPEKAQRVAGLPMREALKALAETKTDKLLDHDDMDLDTVKAVVIERFRTTVEVLEQAGWTPVEIKTAVAWLLDRPTDINEFIAFNEEHYGDQSRSDIALMRDLRRYRIRMEGRKCNKGLLAAPLMEKLGSLAAESKLHALGMDKIPPGLSAILTVTSDGEITVKPEFVFALAADPKASVQAMLAAQILEAAPGAVLSPTGLKLPEDLSFEAWDRIGQLLMAIPGAEATLSTHSSPHRRHV